MSARPLARYLDAEGPLGRLHLQHGPIDLVIGIDGTRRSGPENVAFREKGFRAAKKRLDTVLEELVEELPLLRQPARKDGEPVRGSVAQRMVRAVLPYAEDCFVTAMASVAGAVADEVLAAMLSAYQPDDRPNRIYVNNGGDIALHLEGDAEFRVRMKREDGAKFGDLTMAARDPSRGIATSGRGGRSLSMGIADSVTVVAADGATADAAATLIANTVDLPGHPAITRKPACEVVDESDLGDRPVVVGRGRLTDREIDAALASGTAYAETLIERGLIHRAALFLGPAGRLALPRTSHSKRTSNPMKELHHA
ncbi:UPF0280 family protein [Pararhizobium mangrovi]|uniref:UPF0280 family protein n=1 Tax=Pararhizobium mangrovi TaxID=2590452 RepID=A0A506U8D8_9HYPH|nr:UPF0280 family protein [Pararhizobium mangrovi]TPW30613.1 UPF0280 family protein [Pararhizobium mangrovi]